MTWNLRKELKDLLAQETGTKIYAPGQRTPVAFLYPNTYHLGMSNLGLHILYQVLDSRGWAVERFFLPGRRELPEYIKTKTPLLSVENQRALSEFPYICATMCFELDYVHLLEELRLGRIVLTAADRGEQDSFVVVGGPCATFNPEPLADFVDCFVIGEGEETLPRLLDLLERLRFEGRSRAEKLAAAARLPGIYVPSFYTPQYDGDGHFTGMHSRPEVPETIARQWVQDLDAYPHASAIVSPLTEFADMYIVEVARGCGRHCRFCMAGYCFRKPRNREFDALWRDIDRRPARTAKVGLMGAAVSDYPGMERLTERLVAEHVPFSCASLRADALSPQLVRALAASGQRTMTVAPEAGSAKMRAAINKGITEEHIYEAMEYAAEAGMPNIKLYFMIGLPGEEDEDIAEMIRLVHRVRARMDELGHKGDLILSVNPFIPKPFTPFQWSPMTPVPVLKKRIRLLQAGFRKDRRIRLLTESLKESVQQAVLSRGTRRLGAVLRRCLDEGLSFRDALAEAGFREQELAGEAYEVGAPLPWSHLDMGVRERYLALERDRAAVGAFTPACFEGCRRCGVCHEKA